MTGHESNRCPCGKPAPNTTLCHQCLTNHRNDLQTIARYWLPLLAAKRHGTNTRTIGKTPPIPIDTSPHTQETAYIIRNTLTTWTRHVLQVWKQQPPTDDIPAMAQWLHDTSHWYTRDPWVIELADEIGHCAQQITRAIDRPTEHLPLGQCGTPTEPQREHNETTCLCTCHHGQPCDIDCNPGTPITTTCTQQLKAERGTTHVTCKTCGTTHNVENLKWRAINQMRDLVVPMAELLAMFGAYTHEDRSRMRQRINLWAHRDQLTKRTVVTIDGDILVTPSGVPVAGYRVGEVLDRLQRMNNEKEAG